MSNLSRVEQLNLLQDTLRELFDAGVSEEDAFQQLTADHRFGRVRRTTIKSTYGHFQDKINKQHKKIVAKYSKHADNYRYLSISADAHIREAGWSWYQKVIIDERFVVFPHHANTRDSFHRLTVIDIFNNKLKHVTIPKSRPVLRNLFFLDDEFFLLFESDLGAFHPLNASDFVISLAHFDPIYGNFQKLTTYEKRIWSPKVFPDPAEPSNFVLIWADHNNINQGTSFSVCNVVGTNVEFGEMRFIAGIAQEGIYSFSNNYLYALKFLHGQPGHCQIVAINCNDSSMVTVDLDPFPDNIDFFPWMIRDGYMSGFEDRVFICVKFKSTKKDGVICADFRSRSWEVLKIAVEDWTDHIKAFGSGLIIPKVKRVKVPDSEHQVFYEFYNVPLCKPNLLRRLAWFALVNRMKKKGEENPFTAALKFLPYNSEMRCHFKDN